MSTSILCKLSGFSSKLRLSRNVIRCSLFNQVQFVNYTTTTQTNANVIKKHTLKDQIVQKIKIGGPITIHDYMKVVLTAPNSGFYMKQDVFGSKGHFTTSPEISQIFGELIGAWLLNEWNRFSEPKPLNLVEIGPGRGTLVDDITRVFSQFPKARSCLSISLVEVSPFLRQVQEQNLCGTTSVLEQEDANKLGVHSSMTKLGFPITWYPDIDSVPETSGFTSYIAHEFLDALPIHKFRRNDKGEWREILVDYETSQSANSKENLRFVLSRNETPASKAYIPPGIEANDYEASPDSIVFVDKIVKRLNNNAGLFLGIDYGYTEKLETKINRDTFRAFREHALWHPLEKPGFADLTADVDFTAIEKIAQSNSTFFGPVTQQTFLTSLGVELRLNRLLKKAKDEEEASKLKSGVKMITEDMGQRFKVFSIFPKESKHLFRENPPAGFHS